VAVGQEAVIADALETRRQGVDQEAPNELVGENGQAAGKLAQRERSGAGTGRRMLARLMNRSGDFSVTGIVTGVISQNAVCDALLGLANLALQPTIASCLRSMLQSR
jgi:hypothetical protein